MRRLRKNLKTDGTYGKIEKHMSYPGKFSVLHAHLCIVKDDKWI